MIRFETVARTDETKIQAETKKPEARETKIVRGRGRPRQADIEPWKAVGVSKATWYRRQKKASTS